MLIQQYVQLGNRLIIFLEEVKLGKNKKFVIHFHVDNNL